MLCSKCGSYTTASTSNTCLNCGTVYTSLMPNKEETDYLKEIVEELKAIRLDIRDIWHELRRLG